MRILVVEDEKAIVSLIKKGLESECFVVDVAWDGEQGSSLARVNGYDAIILDYNLPKKNGREVCEEIRRSGKNTPIMMLTVRTETSDKVDLLELGADDYMTKPFSLEELIARVRVLLRRPTEIKDDILKIDDLILDARKHTVQRGGKDIYLTRKEHMLLEYLMRNQGAVLSRAMILEHVWDMNADPFSNTIESHIRSLRKKVDTKTNKLIRTIPGRGYKVDLAN